MLSLRSLLVAAALSVLLCTSPSTVEARRHPHASRSVESKGADTQVPSGCFAPWARSLTLNGIEGARFNASSPAHASAVFGRGALLVDPINKQVVTKAESLIDGAPHFATHYIDYKAGVAWLHTSHPVAKDGSVIPPSCAPFALPVGAEWQPFCAPTPDSELHSSSVSGQQVRFSAVRRGHESLVSAAPSADAFLPPAECQGHKLWEALKAGDDAKVAEWASILPVVGTAAPRDPLRRLKHVLAVHQPAHWADMQAKEADIAIATSEPQTFYPKMLWTGTNNFFMHSVQNPDRGEVLDAAQSAGYKVIRLFMSADGSGTKGGNTVSSPDIEHGGVGTFDDTQLNQIDALMQDCASRGIKLTLALHDRYALGWWGYDAYGKKYGFPDNPGKGSDTSRFYTDSNAGNDLDNRYKHIMNHNNGYFGKPWSQLNNVIFSVEPENEPQSYNSNVDGAWLCNRATNLKSAVSFAEGLLITTGGFAGSGGAWDPHLDAYAACGAIDVLALHNYYGKENTRGLVTKAYAAASGYGKRVMVQEFGAKGSDAGSRASYMTDLITDLIAQCVAYTPWELTKPGNQDGSDFEYWTNQQVWTDSVLPLAKQTPSHWCACWPEVNGGTTADCSA